MQKRKQCKANTEKIKPKTNSNDGTKMYTPAASKAVPIALLGILSLCAKGFAWFSFIECADSMNYSCRPLEDQFFDSG